MLLLDDIWERLDLTELGVPHPIGDGNISKVIFTTRSEEVCHVMEAHQHQKVECLASDEALSLFRMKVGEDTFNSHPEIPTLAEEIVKILTCFSDSALSNKHATFKLSIISYPWFRALWMS